MRLTYLLTKITESLRKKYHQKFPQDPALLYDYLLKNHLKDINKLLKKKILKQDQYDLLFPLNKKTDSMTFDATLLVLQMRSFWFKKPPKEKKWNDWPDKNDNSDAAHLNRIRLTRNKIQHAQQEIDENTFVDIFKKVTISLIAFGSTTEEIEVIKTCKLQRNTFSLKEFFISSISVIVLAFAIYFAYVYVIEHPSEKSFNIQNVSPTFFGRESEIEAIHTNFTTKNQYKGIVLHGLSGVGKSQIAKRYCQQFGKHYANNIAWLHSSNAFSIKKNMEDFAEQLGFQVQGQNIARTKEQVYNYFRKTNALIIFDNVMNVSDIEAFLPNAFQKNIKVLITSQITTWNIHYHKIPIKVFTKETALKFFKTVFGDVSVEDTKHLEFIADTLQYHPLALQQAVSYIKASQLEMNNYVRLLNESFFDLMNEPCDEIEIDCKPVLKAINLTIHLFQSQASNESIKILNDMAFLNGSDIRRGFFKNFCEDINDLQLNRILKSMEKFSLISIVRKDNHSTYIKDDFVEIHTLVQRVFEINLKMKINYQTEFETFYSKLVNRTVRGITVNRTRLKYLKNHLKHMLENDELSEMVLNSFNFNSFILLFRTYDDFLNHRKTFQKLSDHAKNNQTAMNYLKIIFHYTYKLNDPTKILNNLQKFWQDKKLIEEYYFTTKLIGDHLYVMHDRENLRKTINEMEFFKEKKCIYSSVFRRLKNNLDMDVSGRCSSQQQCKIFKERYLNDPKNIELLNVVIFCLLNTSQYLEALNFIEVFERSILVTFDVEEFQQEHQIMTTHKMTLLILLRKWEKITDVLHSSDTSKDFFTINTMTYGFFLCATRDFAQKFHVDSNSATKRFYNEVIRLNTLNNDTVQVLHFKLIMLVVYFKQRSLKDEIFIKDFSLILTKLSKHNHDL